MKVCISLVQVGRLGLYGDCHVRLLIKRSTNLRPPPLPAKPAKENRASPASRVSHFCREHWRPQKSYKAARANGAGPQKPTRRYRRSPTASSRAIALIRNRKFADSPLEGAGFEPSVPRLGPLGYGRRQSRSPARVVPQVLRSQAIRTTISSRCHRSLGLDQLVGAPRARHRQFFHAARCGDHPRAQRLADLDCGQPGVSSMSSAGH
jgi:hypothetical protein